MSALVARVKASTLPSRRQPGSISSAWREVIRRTLVPSAFMIAMSSPPPAKRWVAKAISVPSGENWGSVSMPGAAASRCTSVPSGRIVWMSKSLPVRSDVKTIRVPSGEKAGWSSERLRPCTRLKLNARVVKLVILRRSVPSARAIVMPPRSPPSNGLMSRPAVKTTTSRLAMQASGDDPSEGRIGCRSGSTGWTTGGTCA